MTDTLDVLIKNLLALFCILSPTIVCADNLNKGWRTRDVTFVNFNSLTCRKMAFVSTALQAAVFKMTNDLDADKSKVTALYPFI